MSKLELTNEQRKVIDDWLFSDVKEWLTSISKDEYLELYVKAYKNWFRGGRGWWPIRQGGTGQMYMIMWYQNKLEKPNKEWRPKKIINQVLNHLSI